MVSFMIGRSWNIFGDFIGIEVFFQGGHLSHLMSKPNLSKQSKNQYNGVI